jgi:hypothetical protein
MGRRFYIDHMKTPVRRNLGQMSFRLLAANMRAWHSELSVRMVWLGLSRDAAISRAEAYFHSGAFRDDLARRIGMPTESQNPDRAPVLVQYVEAELKPAFEAHGFVCQILSGQLAIPFRTALGGRKSADGAGLWPRRRSPRA